MECLVIDMDMCMCMLCAHVFAQGVGAAVANLDFVKGVLVYYKAHES